MTKVIKWIIGCFMFVCTPFESCSNEDTPIVDEDDIITIGDKSGEEAYWALYDAHIEALKTGKSVRYSKEDIHITIPEDAKPIPLTNNTDFGGSTIIVENKVIDGFFLFTLIGEAKPIEVSQRLLGGSNFSSVPELCKGTVLLLLWDENPWVKKRKGYSYGATRQDNLLLKDGIAQNEPVMPWDNPDTTKPRVTYVQTDDDEKVIQNLTFTRTESSTMKTMLVRVEFQNNVLLDKITINTPDNDEMFGDYVVRVYNSANVTVRDVTINGTYSQKDQFGYGMNMLNDWNTHFIRLNADGKWGIFGTNNMNKVLLEDCNINRFDIHCYGRDITMRNCSFNHMYNQFSSIFGTIRYEQCVFHEHTPYLNETSYNCFTPFTLEMKNCVWEVQAYGIPEALCVMGSLTDEYNERQELSRRAYPNVYIDGLSVKAPSKYKELYVFYNNEDVSDSRPIDYIKIVEVRRMMNEGNSVLKLWNKDIVTANNVVFNVE